jgi:energy-coupling factor transport system permease protein
MELLRSAAIGQYIPRDSPIHRLDPRTKIGAAFVLTLVIFVLGGFAATALFAALLLALFAAGQIPLGFVLRGLRPVLFLIALTFILNLFFSGIHGGTPLVGLGPVVITAEALSRAVFIALRLILLIATTSLFTFTTSPMALTDGMERLLRPFRRIGIPGHELAMMMSIALRFIPTLLEETERIMKAQMARGASFQEGNILRRARALLPVLVPLFLSAFRRADELALAMEARAYRGGEGRTRMRELRFARRDVAAVIVTAAASAVILLPRWLGVP